MTGRPRDLILLRLYALLLVLIGALLAAGGGWLLGLGGSAYYLVTGLAVLLAAVLLWRADRRGAWVYGAMLGGTVLWSLWEAGLNGWALAPRLIGPFVLGAFLLTPYVQRRLDRRPLPAGGGRAVAGAGALALLLAGVALFQARDDATAALPAPAAAPLAMTADAIPDGDWPAWGRTAGGTRFSPLIGIDAGNVGKLAPAWTFHVDKLPPGPKSGLEVTPLKLGDSLYLCDGVNRVYALDADSGRLKWKFDPKADVRGLIVATCRGVAFYRMPGAAAGSECAERIFTSAVDAKLWAIDAATGRPCSGFGTGGSVDLKHGIGPHIRGYYSLTSAPTVVRGRIVLGGWVTDNQMIGEPSGVVRAFDAATGAFAWAWDMGRPGNNREPGPGEHYTHGTPNVWAPPSADEALGLVFLPTGNATPDFWGGFRTPEMDRYASAVVALDAETGQPRWSFQTTHHDLWDYDVPSQPTLVDIPDASGRIVPALIQPTKRAETFVLDRRTGRPIVPVEERPVPQGAPAGDRLSPTQPFSAMPSFAGPPLTEAMMWGLTPIDQLWCRIKFREARYEGTFTPPGTKPFIFYPGYSGGSSWGGVSVDPERRLMVMNINRFAQYGRLVPRAEADAMGMKPVTRSLGGGEKLLGHPQIGTPFGAIIGPFMSPLGMPCQQPPFGMIGVVDLATRKVLWQRPFGNAADSGPLGLATNLPIPLGTPNLGGSLITRSGLVFIGATQERRVRALDLESGRELWGARLPAGGHATPMTYRSDRTGRQYVVIAAGGNILLSTRQSDAVIAYAVPREDR